MIKFKKMYNNTFHLKSAFQQHVNISSQELFILLATRCFKNIMESLLLTTERQKIPPLLAANLQLSPTAIHVCTHSLRTLLLFLLLIPHRLYRIYHHIEGGMTEFHQSVQDLQSTTRLANSWMFRILDTRKGFPRTPLNVVIDYFSHSCLIMCKTGLKRTLDMTFLDFLVLTFCDVIGELLPEWACLTFTGGTTFPLTSNMVDIPISRVRNTCTYPLPEYPVADFPSRPSLRAVSPCFAEPEHLSRIHPH